MRVGAIILIQKKKLKISSVVKGANIIAPFFIVLKI